MNHSLEARTARATARARAGDATVLIIHSEEERAEATRLADGAPLIICSGPECRRFLEFLRNPPKPQKDVNPYRRARRR
jgi:hypothetical protein